MKLTEKQMETAKCTLIDETSDFILARVCSLMYETANISGGELDLEQIDELVTNVFKGLYYEETETKQ
tara:strand:- start:267 stop:470 length:204 start_codon:yes stop_codon:yes gene_type:complete